MESTRPRGEAPTHPRAHEPTRENRETSQLRTSIAYSSPSADISTKDNNPLYRTTVVPGRFQYILSFRGVATTPFVRTSTVP